MFECDCKQSEYGHQAGCQSMKAIYPELVGDWVGGKKAPPPKFPDVCPGCGAEVIRPVSRRTAVYACGGSYSPKPQIQNHTDKWWGHCKRS